MAIVLVARLTSLQNQLEATDYENYYRPVAESIAAGDGITLDGDLATRYPPGYPALLAVFSPLGEWGSVTALNAVSLAASAVLVLLIASRLVDQARGPIAGALLISYPPLVVLAATPSTELPFIALVLGATLAALVAREGAQSAAFVAGGLVGAAALVRPSGILVGLLMIMIIYAGGRGCRSWVPAVGVVVGLVVALAPWAWRLQTETGDMAVLGSQGTATVASGLAIEGRDEAERRPWGMPPDVRRLSHDAISERSTLRSASDVGAFLVDQGPTRVAELLAVKAVRSWYATDSVRHEGLVALVQVPYLVLAGVGTMRLVRDRRRLALGLCWSMIGYFWLVTIASVSIARYTVPAAPFLMILVVNCNLTSRSRRARRTAAAAGG